MPNDPLKPWGPDNPHPLSTRTTELIWEGKYNEYGERRPIQLPTFPLVLQKIETIDAPRDQAKAQGSLFDDETAHSDDFRNLLIWGDNKLALATLIQTTRGKVNFVYIDPPFDIGADFTVTVGLGEDDAIFKEQSVLEAVAYRDMWGRGTDSYLYMMYERLIIMRDLLAEDGAVVVHVGDKVAATMRLLLEEIFGGENYRNTIIIPRGIKNVQAQFEDLRSLSVGHDVLLFFSKSNNLRIPKLSVRGAESVPGKWDTFWRGTDRPTMRYELFGQTPRTGQWRWSRERAYKAKDNYDRFIEDNSGSTLDDYYQQNLGAGEDLDFLRLGPDNTVQYYVPPRDYKLASTLWTDVRTKGNLTQYQHEKHEELVGLLIEWLTQPGHLVLDCFSGSGTTAAAAEKLGRRWIVCDLGRYAIHTTRKRLIGVQRELHAKNQPYRSFDVYNLGRYERQWWQMERLMGRTSSTGLPFSSSSALRRWRSRLRPSFMA